MMKPTKELPPEFEELYKLDLPSNKGLMIWMNLFAIGLLLVFGVWFTRTSMRVRPDLWQDGAPTVTGGEIPALILVLVLMVFLHEGVHGFFFWLYTGERPRFAFKGAYAYAAMPGWYFPRTLFLINALAPLVLLSVLGVLAMRLIPLSWVPALIFFLTFNGAGSIGDIFTVVWVLYRPKEVLVQDVGDVFTIYGLPDSVDSH